MGRQTGWLAALTALLCLFACSGDDPARPDPRPARNIHIAADGSGDYPTIQAAIDASADGDTISLDNGRYTGAGNWNLDFGGRAIVLRGKSGDPVSCVIGAGGLVLDDYRGIWFHSEETSSSIVENITIENTHVAYGGGGGVLCEGTSPTFRNVIFDGNESEAVGSHAGSPTFIDCVFQRNYDGAIFFRAGSPKLLRCLFAGNYIDGRGAAVSAWYSDVTVEDCAFVGNAATFGGAAIESWATGESGPGRITVTNTLFVDNTSGYHGGAVMCSETSVTFENCVFSRNQCGMMGGAVDCSYRSPGRITGCVFHGNSGTEGAAINCEGDSLLVIENSVISSNTGSAAIQCGTFGEHPFPPKMLCTDVYGNPDGDWTDCLVAQDSLNGNVSVDPMFCDALEGDFRLRPDSPLVTLDCPPLAGWPAGCGASSRTETVETWRRLLARIGAMRPAPERRGRLRFD